MAKRKQNKSGHSVIIVKDTEFAVEGIEEMLSDLDKRIFPGDDRYDFDLPNHLWWGVVRAKDSELVGFGGLMLLPEQEFGFFCLAGLLPEDRGQGLHRRLISVRTTAARKRGLKSVISYTTKENCSSSNNLSRSGFYMYRPEHMWAGNDVIYWKKDL